MSESTLLLGRAAGMSLLVLLVAVAGYAKTWSLSSGHRTKDLARESEEVGPPTSADTSMRLAGWILAGVAMCSLIPCTATAVAWLTGR